MPQAPRRLADYPNEALRLILCLPARLSKRRVPAQAKNLERGCSGDLRWLTPQVGNHHVIPVQDRKRDNLSSSPLFTHGRGHIRNLLFDALLCPHSYQAPVDRCNPRTDLVLAVYSIQAMHFTR